MWVGGNCSGPTRGVSPAPSSSLSGDPHIMSPPTCPGGTLNICLQSSRRLSFPTLQS